jgi:hypothetical protein
LAGNTPVGVQDGTTGGFAGDRLVEDRREVFSNFQGSVEGSDGDHGPGGLDAGGWPDVPGETDTWKLGKKGQSEGGETRTVAFLDVFKVEHVRLDLFKATYRNTSKYQAQGARDCRYSTSTASESLTD